MNITWLALFLSFFFYVGLTVLESGGCFEIVMIIISYYFAGSNDNFQHLYENQKGYIESFALFYNNCRVFVFIL